MGSEGILIIRHALSVRSEVLVRFLDMSHNKVKSGDRRSLSGDGLVRMDDNGNSGSFLFSVFFKSTRGT